MVYRMLKCFKLEKNAVEYEKNIDKFCRYGMIYLVAMEGFPSGQRGQTVNLLSTTSKVRILLPPVLLNSSV